MKLAFIGGGVMGEAIIASVLKNGPATREEIVVCDVLRSRRDLMEQIHGIKTTERPAEAAEDASIVIFAVKPQDFANAAQSLTSVLSPSQTVMSIMAGVTIDTIAEALNHWRIVRAIPNTPCQIGQGVTVWTATEGVPADTLETVRGILAVLGLEVYVGEEKYIDMATAVSSSGPAYVFLVIEALIDAAVHIGLRRELAETMVVQTVLGAAAYSRGTGRHPAQLRNQVTSPGGTTTEALLVLERAGVRAAFIDAVEAAYTKAQLLGE